MTFGNGTRLSLSFCATPASERPRDFPVKEHLRDDREYAAKFIQTRKAKILVRLWMICIASVGYSNRFPP